MPEGLPIQQVVDRVLGILQSEDVELTESLRASAEEFSQAVQQVNRRLQASGEYLRKGLKVEAINLADAEPKLLDLVETLDIPEWDDWMELTRLYDLPRPPRLLIEEATALNEAYGRTRPLEDLLYQHRLMAIQRAPLQQRLEVLRALAAQDREHAFWQEDVETFEKARLEELAAESKSVADSRDSFRLLQLRSELDPSRWQTTVPENLRRTVEAMWTQWNLESKRAELENLAQELDHARQDDNEFQGLSLARRWQELATAAGLDRDSRLRSRVRDAFDWVEEIRERQHQEEKIAATIGTIQTLLEDSKDPSHSLQRALQLAESIRGSVPTHILTAIDRQRRRLRSARQSRWAAGIGIVVVTVGLLASLLGYVLWTSTLRSRIFAQQAELSKLLDEGNYLECRRRFDELEVSDPRVHGSHEVQSLAARLAEQELADGQRRTQVLRLLDQYAEQPLNRVDPPPGLDPKLPDEKEQFEQTKKERERRRDEAQSQVDQVVNAEIRSVREAIRELAELVKRSESPPNAETRVNDMSDQLKDLESEDRTVEGIGPSASVKEDLRNLRRDLAQLQTKVKESNATRRQLADVTSAAANQDMMAFERAVKTHADQFKQDVRARQMRSVLDHELDVWKAELAYAAAFRSLNLDKADESEPNRAAGIAEAIATLLRDHPKLAERNELTATEQRLRAAGMRKVAAGRIINSIERPVLQVATLVLGPNNERYYLPKAPDKQLDGQSVVLEYYTDPRSEVTRKASFVAQFGIDFLVRDPAPQVLLARQLKGNLSSAARLKDSDWDATIIRGLHSVAEDVHCDEIFRVQLLRTIAADGAVGSTFLADALKDLQRHLNNAKVDDDTNWVDPNSESGNKQRPVAAKALATLPNIEDVARRIDKHYKDRKLAASPKQIVGWIDREGDAWKVNWSKRERSVRWKPNVSLYVVIPKGDGVAWTEVGRFHGSEFTLNSTSAAEAIAMGRLVWIDE